MLLAGSQDSVVCIGSRVQTGQLMTCSSISSRDKRFFCPPKISRLYLGCTLYFSNSVGVGIGGLFSVVVGGGVCKVTGT